MPPWSALNDLEILRRCGPGGQSREMVSPTAMAAIVVLKVGPVKATASGKVTLTDIDAPSGCRIVGEGTGGVAGFAKGGAKVSLTEETTGRHYAPSRSRGADRRQRAQPACD